MKRVLTAVALAATMLLNIAGGAGPAAASGPPERVLVCHYTGHDQERKLVWKAEIPAPAAEAHISHGDPFGPACGELVIPEEEKVAFAIRGRMPYFLAVGDFVDTPPSGEFSSTHTRFCGRTIVRIFDSGELVVKMKVPTGPRTHVTTRVDGVLLASSIGKMAGC